MKILFMDLENLQRPEHIFHPGKRGRFSSRAAGFCADLAYILVFGYKWLGDKKAHSIQATKKDFKSNPLTDETFLQEIFEVMNQADVVVTWYGSGHDFPFLTTRLAKHGMYLDQKTCHLDLFKTAGKHLRLSSNSLNSVAKFFGLAQKIEIDKCMWSDCWMGKYDSLMVMAEYCRQDVEVLEQVYHKLIPLGTALPNRPGEGCHTCGGTALQKNGYRVTKTHRYVRMRCTKCGASQKGERIL